MLFQALLVVVAILAALVCQASAFTFAKSGFMLKPAASPAAMQVRPVMHGSSAVMPRMPTFLGATSRDDSFEPPEGANVHLAHPPVRSRISKIFFRPSLAAHCWKQHKTRTSAN